jgi:hypothetical protein
MTLVRTMRISEAIFIFQLAVVLIKFVLGFTSTGRISLTIPYNIDHPSTKSSVSHTGEHDHDSFRRRRIKRGRRDTTTRHLSSSPLILQFRQSRSSSSRYKKSTRLLLLHDSQEDECSLSRRKQEKQMHVYFNPLQLFAQSNNNEQSKIRNKWTSIITPSYGNDDNLHSLSSDKTNNTTKINLLWMEDFVTDTKIPQQSQPQSKHPKTMNTSRITNTSVLPKKFSATNYNSNATLISIIDLEEYLRRNEFVTKADLLSSLDALIKKRQKTIEEGEEEKTSSVKKRKKSYPYFPSGGEELTSGSKKGGFSSSGGSSSSGTSSITASSSRGTVGFPQQSILTDTLVIRCTTATSGMIGLLIGRTVAANLWLLGFIVGVVYGNKVATDDVQQRSSSRMSADGAATTSVTSSSSTSGIMPNFFLACGKRFGRAVLAVYDAINVLWYMYKTGKLSYAYYKQYESLDSRFQITDKIDAWNTRFQEGKLKFDRWEKENEISRKLLAGLRTFWMVEEQSLKRASKKFSPKNR